MSNDLKVNQKVQLRDIPLMIRKSVDGDMITITMLYDNEDREFSFHQSLFESIKDDELFFRDDVELTIKLIDGSWATCYWMHNGLELSHLFPIGILDNNEEDTWTLEDINGKAR